MTVKLIIASVVILSALGFGAMSFIESNVEYTDFQTAMKTAKKVQVKGEWMKEQRTTYDAKENQFHFSMRDDNGTLMQIIYDGPSPNNFELASSIVIKGRMEKNIFHASEILTKCPSKYEAAPSQH